ncbi:TPA: Ig-like domain-containing protein, partial [Photobacterium damselae]
MLSIKPYLGLGLSIFLAACHSGSPSVDPTPPPVKTVSINAQDTLQFITPDTPFVTVKLASKVVADNTQPLSLTSVTPLSPQTSQHCDVRTVNKDQLSFTVSPNDVGTCRFQYTIEPQSQTYSGHNVAVSQVVVTDTPPEVGEYLPPISKALAASESDHDSTLNIDLSHSLPSDEDGTPFSLDSDSIELLGETSPDNALGTYSVSGNTITYTAPVDSQGVVRLYYSAINAAHTQVRPGIIYIGIGQPTNTSPSAQPIVTLDPSYLALTPKQTIDITPYINDPDGDSLQLVGVYGNGLGAISNITSGQFTYQPYHTGPQYITYVISDHNGGYAIGQITFQELMYPSIFDATTKTTFYPPPTQDELSRGDETSSGLHREDGTQGLVGDYPIFNQALAQAYCIVHGMVLPSVAQLKGVFSRPLDGKSVFSDARYRWSSGVDYVASDGRVSLNDGTSSTDTSTAGYLSCASPVKLIRIDIVASPIKISGVSSLTLPVGYKQSFEAVGYYSDGSSSALTDLNVSNWHSSNSDAGRFYESGVFTATNKGNTTITATKDGVTSNTVDMKVTAAIITAI